MQNVFLFPPVLNLGAQVRCPKNRYTDLKSALDQPLKMLIPSIFDPMMSLVYFNVF